MDTTDPGHPIDSSLRPTTIARSGRCANYGDAMDARALGVAVLLAALGVAGGYAAITASEDEPARMSTAAPVPGQSPSYPSDPVVRVLPDPGTPALAAALPLHTERLGGRAFGMRLPVPDGWLRTDSDLVEAKWKPPGGGQNTYLLRVKIVSGLRLTIEQAMRQRMDDLEATVTDFELEASTSDTFVATYVSDSYRRLAMERYVSLDGSETAYATIVVVGRVADRDGMADLLAQVTDGAQRIAG
jgi:hypothetical protein